MLTFFLKKKQLIKMIVTMALNIHFMMRCFYWRDFVWKLKD